MPGSPDAYNVESLQPVAGAATLLKISVSLSSAFNQLENIAAWNTASGVNDENEPGRGPPGPRVRPGTIMTVT